MEIVSQVILRAKDLISTYPTLTRIILALITYKILSRLYTIYARKSVKGQVVLITGGASGIGRLMAFRFSSLGATVVLWDMNTEGLRKVAEEISNQTGGAVHTYTVDITDRLKVHDMASQVKSRVGKVDILVNNAGIVGSGNSILSEEFSEKLAERVIAINTTSHIYTIRAFVGDMVERNRGHIVTIASAAGLVGTCGLADYCASKFGAVGLNESLRREFKKRNLHGCHTTVVCPFYINTGMFEGVKTTLMPILDEKYVANKIVDAVRENQEFLGLPALVHYTARLLPALFPVSVVDWVYKVMRLSSTMDEFVGRKEKY